MKGHIKKNRVMIKNIIFIICLIVLSLQFRGSFVQLTELIDTNQPYAQTNQYGGIQITQQEHITYVRADTLQIYTYKLIQSILLLFGIFMCLVFMAINNHEFSLIKLSEEIKG